MIGDGWDGEPSIRPGAIEHSGEASRARIAVVTGSRAEFGLLRPVMRAVAARPDLELLVVAAGSHLVSPALTLRDVQAEFPVFDSVPMQIAGRVGRAEDAESVGRGVGRFARVFERASPTWVVVLGDRIEAFAAAAAAAIGGWALAHIHGGDRAEGVADESMRHAITKLAHLHFAATEQSRSRLVRMGEDPSRVHLAGSPAIDGLAEIPALPEDRDAALGSPEIIALLHPVGRADEHEEAAAAETLNAALHASPDLPVVCLAPNLDPGRSGVLRAIARADKDARRVKYVEHLPRPEFVGLLKRVAARRGVLVGNSSAGLIEAAALRLAAVDVGPRQRARERPANVVHVERESAGAIIEAIARARALDLSALTHPYGDGRSGERIADLLSRTDPRRPGFLRKICAY